MMRTLREKTKVIIGITAAAFLGLMVFQWGMDISGRSARAGAGEIGRVNGESVAYEEFLRVYNTMYEQQRQLQDEPISMAQTRQIEDAAWEQVVMDLLLNQEVERRGIDVTDEEIRQAARYAPPPQFYSNPLFQTDGQFDPAKYEQFMASSGDPMLLLQLESYYRQMIPRNKLYRQVVAGSYITDAELWRAWKDRNEQVRVRYLALDPEAIVPEGAVTVTDDEVRAFYREHQDEFVRPARARVRLVVLDKSPTAADTAAARNRALELRREILGGADFAEVAKRESADPGTAQKGGDLGTFGKGVMTPAFEQAVWSLPLRRVSEPVLTPFGFHLIQVTRRTSDEASARHILIPIERGEESELALLDRADSLEALGETMSLEAAAAQQGLSTRTATFNRELPLVAGLGQVDEGADWAFNEAEPGDVSPLFETPNAYYMFELLEREPEGTFSFDEAATGIRIRLTTEKTLERARQIGREVVDQVRSSSIEDAARARGLEVREAGPFARGAFVPGLGRANAAIGTAFGLDVGETSGLVEADGTLFIIQTVEKIPADSAAFEEQKDELRARIAAGLEQERWTRFLAALKENADIEDFREQVLRPREAQA
ncbi:MAG TPA: SurA N-terminal domain-containing protein [Longimicrobiales bacterium]